MLENLAKVADLPTRQMCDWGLQRLQHVAETNIVKLTHEVEFTVNPRLQEPAAG